MTDDATYYSLLADLVMLIHFLFIAFVTVGALLLWKYPRLLWLHVVAVIWAVYIQSTGGYCPLTPLENGLRAQSGRATYDESFVEHYLGAIIYPGDMPSEAHIVIAIAIFAFNVAAYLLLWLRKRGSKVTIKNSG